MAEQMGFDFGDGEMKKPTKAEEAKEKAKARAAENEDFKDKRTPRSELIQKAEMAKIKADADARDAARATRAQSSMISPQGNTTAAGRGTAYGGGGGGMSKLNRDITKNYKKGGAVKSASSRGDGCAQRGKTKGRMV